MVVSAKSPAPAAAPPTAPASQALLFQLEIDGRDALRPRTPPPQRDLHSSLIRLEALTRPETSFEARLARDARYYHAAILEEEGRADVVILASRLAGVGYPVTIRAALGGGSGVLAFKHLSHEFLLVAGPADGYNCSGSAECIVDPRFREQFDIPQTVDWYDELLLSVPETYVGPPNRLRALVRLLSSEMAAAFVSAGAVTPPWRFASSLLSKWLPQRARDTLVGDGAGSPSASLSALSLPLSRPSGFTDFSAELRTTSAPGVVAGNSSSSGNGCAPAAKWPPSLQSVPPLPLDGRSDSEEDRLSSPDTTLVYGFARRAAAGKSGDANSGDAMSKDEAQPNRGEQPQLHRTISREQLAAEGSGGRSPRRNASAAAATALLPSVPALRPPDEPAPPPQYAAHPQAPPPRRQSAPDAAAARMPVAPTEGPQLRRSSTSALSSKLASVGLAPQSEKAAKSQKAASPCARPPVRRSNRTGGDASPQQLRSGTGTLPAGVRLYDSLQRLQHPQQQQQQQSEVTTDEPSVHAPFWHQPLIMDYIAAQHPDTAGGTLHGGAGGKAPAPAAAAAATLQTGGEPRIRTVKMRGAGAGGFHLPSRVRAH